MSSEYIKQIIVMRRLYPDKDGKLIKLRTGKMIAQACHASMIFLSEIVKKNLKLTEEQEKWLKGRFTKICVYVDTVEELEDIFLKASEAKLTVKMVTDAGQTEFHDVPTKTCLAIGPNWASEIDKITKDLPLL